MFSGVGGVVYYDFQSAISRVNSTNCKIVAEIKHASPSKGVLTDDFDPVAIAQTYTRNGTSDISVLTETKYFQGSLNHLKDVRNALGNKRPPLLRKDFITDPYQIYESRTYGADSLLLIVAILNLQKLKYKEFGR